ncbi:MAG: phosphoesterase PA-phosphatase related protein [Bacteroidetes bacterium]|nr:phosphoesterase PA-phosphatase related protein [Bacteroidota bacterium]
MQHKSVDVRTVSRNNFPFLIPYALFLLAGAILIIANSKAETHLEFNRFHNHFFDIFFQYLTYFGDGYIAIITVVVLLTVKFRYALLTALASLISALITQTLKHTLFSEVVRPAKFFEGLHDLYLVPGMENNFYNSFPSGHTTCAFALYFSIALIVENRGLKFFCFLFALAIGYSRIYLSQHFFEDVYAGSLIGVITTLIVYLLLRNSQAPWMDHSLRVLKRAA